MFNRLIFYLECNSILYNYQFGLRKNHSTSQAFIDVVDNIYQNVDDSLTVVGIYILTLRKPSILLIMIYYFINCKITESEVLLIIGSKVISGLKQQLAKISFCSLDTAHSARNLGFIFDEHISFSDQISALSKSCYSHIRQLRCIWPYIDHKTASTIATSIVHSKLDYCNSLHYNLPNTQLNCLQHIQNSLARAVVIW